MAGKIHWVHTSPSAPWQTGEVAVAASAASPDLRFTCVEHQRVLGFGGCFNELGWEALGVLDAEQRSQVLRSLFDPTEGCGFTWGRVPVGASDYALEWYSHNEVDGDLAMEQFSIARDYKYLIPYIRAAQAIQPGLRFLASPWSPPTWMKHPKAYNYGRIRWEPAVLKAYALYLLKFVQAYQAEGIPVEQLHVQNEPDSDQKFPSCRWSGEALRDFIRDYVGPTFRRSGIDCEVWLGTIERGDFNGWVNAVLSDPAARAFVAGAGFQWAGKAAVQRVHETYPDLPLMQTENECGDGKNSWEYARYVFDLMHHYFSNGVDTYMYWNMVLARGGESTWGWKQNSMICVDPVSRSITFNPEYYVMKHFAHFVPAGSVRLGLAGPWAGNSLAFATPGGRRVLVVSNPFEQERTMTLADTGVIASMPLAPQSFHTFVW